jgi:integrase
MVLFKVNTGCREQEVCQLRWEWEIGEHGVFVIPAFIDGEQMVKNGEDRVVVLNSIAQRVVESRRGKHPEFVFTYARGRKNPIESPVTKMNNSAWKSAWRAAGLPTGPTVVKGVHNLKHTLGRRLRAVGCPVETRKVLLGHKDGDITTHYSAAELEELRDWLERQADRSSAKTPALTVLSRKIVG